MSRSITINDKTFPIWPDDMDVQTLNPHPPMFWTGFSDYADYHQPLIDRILELEKKGELTHRMPIGGSKVRNIHEWGIPEADLIHARAIEYLARATSKDPSEIKVDTCWASVTRKHEYLSPHSHTNSFASIVYFLQLGDYQGDNFLDGRLAFVDPRIPHCCPAGEGIATEELPPNMLEGAMVMFPSELLHFVHPYTGDQPRISLAWNLYF